MFAVSLTSKRINMETQEVTQHGGYANLTNDYMFKRIFGSEECKDILISFLNRIVGNGKKIGRAHV